MRVRRDERVVLAERVGAVARPRIRTRMRGESRAHRVLLDIAHAREQIPPRVDRRRIVAFLPHRVRVTVSRREVARIAFDDRRHQARGACCARRCEKQVHVVSHQGVGVNGAFLALCASTQCVEIGGAIARAGKTSRTSTTALHHVQRSVGFFGAGKTRHGVRFLRGQTPRSAIR